MIRCLLTLLLAVALCPAGLAAQGSRFGYRREVPAPALASMANSLPPAVRTHRSPVLLVLGGILGGAAGGVAGGLGGAAIEQSDGCRGSDQCGLGGFIIGGAGGLALGAPLGVHVANGGRGSFGKSLLLSSLVTAAVGGLAYATRSEEIAYLMPATQIGTAVIVEIRTSR
ncbi:MAG TPA: hypothetical protein VFT04_09750 [Gemmatimonadales bacterium]|nr:hypothetical protein [Gemmatimonadales bacterium]